MKPQPDRKRRGERGAVTASVPSAPPRDATVARRTPTFYFWRYLLGGSALLLLAGLYLLTLTYSRYVPLVYDEAIYLQIADAITRTGCPISATGSGAVFSDNPPLVMYASAALRLLGVDSLLWLRIAHVTLLALPTYVAVWLLTANMFGPGASALALLSFYTQHRFILEASEIKLDVPLASMSALFLLSLYRWRERGWYRGAHSGYAAACAVFAGLAFLSKHEGALVPIAGTLFVALSRLDRRHAAPTQSAPIRFGDWMPLVWILAGFALSATAWFVLATGCGGSILGALIMNFQRTTFQSNEPWFHRGLLVYWAALGDCVGPLLVGGVAVAVVLWGKRLVTDRRLLLLGLWVIITFTFCSAIGLRNERYFLPAVPALAILVGSLAAPEAYAGYAALRDRPRAALALRLVIVLAAAAVAVMSYSYTAADLGRYQRVGARSDAFYAAIASVVRQAVPEDECVLLSRPQTAYLAHRNYFLSEYTSDADELVRVLSSPENRITLVAMDSGQMLRDDMPAAEQSKVWSYLRDHFTLLPGTPPGSAVYRRLSW